MYVTCLLAQADTVCKQLYFRLVGIYRHLGHVFYTVHIAFAADMHKRLIGQPCFIRIESIFLVLTVKRNESLVVHTVFSTLGTGICCEVEHIPYVASPDIRSGEQLLDQLLMIISLIFFGIIALLRIGGVPVQCLAAIFTHTYRKSGMHCMELVHPGTVHRSIPAVPAEIVIPGYRIRNGHIFTVHWTHGYHSHGSQSCLIHFVAKVI